MELITTLLAQATFITCHYVLLDITYTTFMNITASTPADIGINKEDFTIFCLGITYVSYEFIDILHIFADTEAACSGITYVGYKFADIFRVYADTEVTPLQQYLINMGILIVDTTTLQQHLIDIGLLTVDVATPWHELIDILIATQEPTVLISTSRPPSSPVSVITNFFDLKNAV